MKARNLIVAAIIVFGSAALRGQSPAVGHGFNAVAFVYFVLLDPSSVVPVVEREIPGKGIEFTRIDSGFPETDWESKRTLCQKTWMDWSDFYCERNEEYEIKRNLRNCDPCG